VNTLSSEWNLSCSNVELFTLASLLGGVMLVGVPDPFPGWLTEEIEEAMQAARKALAERGHLTLRPDGQVVMDVVTAALVGTLVAPQAVVLFTETSPDESPRQQACYHRPPLTVLLESEGETLHLGPLEGTSAPYEQIVGIWQVGAQKAVRAETFSLPESAMQSAREALSSGEAAVQKALQQTGAGVKNARALARTLSAPRRNGALVTMRPRKNSWETGGLGMLDGENGLWLLHSFTRQQADWVELIPCSAQKLSAEIEMLLKHFLPRQEA